MECFADYLKNFLSKEKNRLQDNYPGINYKRLAVELESYYASGIVGDDDFLKTVYLPSRSNPVTKFFNKLKEGVPLEYISGRAFFYNSEFLVNKNVLIPRFETELLVEFAKEEIIKLKKTKEDLTVIDVGTGSGVIALSILQEADIPIKMIAVDISIEALEVARRNYFRLQFTINPRSHFELVKSDRLVRVEEGADLIVSNPPYIKREGDIYGVHKSVLTFGPELALFLDDSEYENWFKQFFIQVYETLTSNGVFLMEGHENHLKDLLSLAETLGFIGVIKNDLTGRNRFLKLRKK